MFSPFACVSPRLQQRREEEEELESGRGRGRGEASPFSTTSSTPRSCSPTTTKYTSGKGKKDSFSNYRLNNKKKNPYSTRGLDRFSTLLADLEERKRKIYAQVGSHNQDDDNHDVPYIQFIYSANSGDWVPIVISLGDYNHRTTLSHEHKHKHKHDKAAVCGGGRDKKSQGQGSTQNPPPPPEAQLATAPDGNHTPSSRCTTMITTSTSTKNKHSSKASPKKIVKLQPQQQQKHQQQQEHRKQATASDFTSSSSADDDGIQKSSDQNRSEERWRRRPSEYLPIVLVLSLLWLLMFGRSVAILLTSAWWYLVPTIIKTPIRPHHPAAATPINNPNKLSSLSNVGKKDYARRLSYHENNKKD